MNNTSSSSSYLRAAHLATKAPDVDLYINDRLAASNLKYRDFTKYIELSPGIYNIKLYEAGTNKKPAFDTDISILPNSIITAAVYSQDRVLNAALIEESTIKEKNECSAKVRAAQYIENTSPVDIILVNGPVLVKNASYKNVGKYVEVKPGSYDVNVKLSDADVSIFNAGTLLFKAGSYYTLYIIGQLNDYHDPEAIVPLDGISYLK